METPNTGMNRTGMQMSPIDSEAMQDAHSEMIQADDRPQSDAETALAKLRVPYLQAREALGSVPIPATLAGAVEAGTAALKGESAQLLLDKLGERLAFERSGARLYDALIAKCEACLEDDTSMTVDDLRQIRDEEARHMHIVSAAIEQLGGDPTAQTPSADLVGMEAMGLLQVVSDPRTSIGQSLHAILVAELADGAGWELLLTLADAHDQDHLLQECEMALATEREHLAMIETWYAESVGLSYGDVQLERERRESSAMP